MSQENFSKPPEHGNHSVFQEFSPSEREKLSILFERVGFDFKILQEILEEYLQKSGVEEGGVHQDFSMSNVRDAEFNETEKGIREATADLLNGVIHIDSGVVEEHEKTAKKFLAQSHLPEEDHELFIEALVHYKLLKNFIHEYVHMRGHIYYENSPNHASLVAGYDQQFVTRSEDGLVTKKFLKLSLNEAVTEKMALEIYQEYSHRIGSARQARIGKVVLESMEKITKIMLETEDLGGYDNIVETLDLIIVHIATETEIPKEKVWDAFKQGYFAGLPEVQNILAELSDFLAEEFPQMIEEGPNSPVWNPRVFSSKLAVWEANRGKTLAEELQV